MSLPTTTSPSVGLEISRHVRAAVESSAESGRQKDNVPWLIVLEIVPWRDRDPVWGVSHGSCFHMMRTAALERFCEHTAPERSLSAAPRRQLSLMKINSVQHDLRQETTDSLEGPEPLIR